MSSKHTDGQWIADGDRVWMRNKLLATAWSPRAVSDVREDGESWLDMRRRTQPERDAVQAETKANARLIAAAPELLEAAVALEVLLSPLAYDSTQKDWLNRARAAIAKATGEGA